MYITDENRNINSVLENMSESIYTLIKNINLDNVEEIRIRKNMPLVLHYANKYAFVSRCALISASADDAYIVTEQDITRTLELLTGGSIYSHQEQIKSGYITTSGGNRVGIAGRTVINEGKIEYLTDISGFNFRIAQALKGVADNVIRHILCDEKINNTLIISPPGYGKTTMLRDIARQISGRGYKTLIIDERSELAAMNDGVCGYDVGMLTDVLDMCPKSEGIMLAIRSLSPQVIVCDEIGTIADIDAIKSALGCGVAVISSIHSDDTDKLFKQERTKNLASLFDVFVLLGNKEKDDRVKKILTRSQIKDDFFGECRKGQICLK